MDTQISDTFLETHIKYLQLLECTEYLVVHLKTYC